MSMDPDATMFERAEMVLRDHTNMGDACEKCNHRFPYDTCIACGDEWPCVPVQLAQDVLDNAHVFAAGASIA